MPTRLLFVLSAIAGVLFLMNLRSDAQSATGGSFYVSTTGSDSNPGSITAPWKTITHAALSTQPGDTIFLRGGTYTTETEIWIRDARGMGGAPGKFKTIQNYNGEHAILQNGNGIYLSASWIRIQGIQFQGVSLSSNTWDGPAPTNIQIVSNSFYGATPGAAIDVIGSNLLVDKNWIQLKGQSSDAYSGINLHYGSNNVISGNYISGSTGYGIYAYDEMVSQYPSGAAASGYNNILIAGNVIKSSALKSGMLLATGTNFVVQNVMIRNNVIYSNHLNGLDIEVGNGVKVFNNTIYGNGADSIHMAYPASSYQIENVQIENNIMDAACTTCSGRHNVTVTNSGMPGLVLMDNLYWPQGVGYKNVTDSRPLFADPLFTNAAGGDFTLTSSSPAIDAGVNVGLPYNGSAPDLGAFETSGTAGPVPAPPPPVNQAPVVRAGTNQTITLPSTATLAGSATDDGLPAGSTLTVTWTKNSGPGTVTFANSHAVSTTASFSAAGTYVLTLTASDTQLTSSANVTITVNAAPVPTPTPTPDTIPPLVSITGPANGSTVSGSAVAVAASATDNVGVVGVQFKLDGANLGAEDTTSPYSVIWDTTISANGSHTISAVARDAAGNTATASVTVMVSNTTTVTPPPPTTGNNYYVSPNGNDSNNGSLSSPWKTIANALLNTGPGDTVNLRAGTYTESIEMRGDPGNRFGHVMGGSSSGWWTLQSYPGEVATLSGGAFAAYSVQYSRFQNLNFVNGNGIYVGTADWVTPPGPRSSNVQVLNNTFSGSQIRYGFIEVMFDNSLVQGNHIVCTGGGTTTDHGIYLHHGDSNTVRGNVISGASGYQIHVYDERKSYSDPQTFITNAIIEDNVLSGSQSRSGLIVSQGGDTVVNGVLVRNNIMFGNANYGIELTDYGSLNENGVLVYNNTLYNNAQGGITIGNNMLTGSEIRDNIFDEPGTQINRDTTGSIGLTVNNNLYWPTALRLNNITDSNALIGDPKFVNPTADFHLQAGSAAIDKAVTLSQVPVDKDGISRPVGPAPDLGAYEYH